MSKCMTEYILNYCLSYGFLHSVTTHLKDKTQNYKSFGVRKVQHQPFSLLTDSFSAFIIFEQDHYFKTEYIFK